LAWENTLFKDGATTPDQQFPMVLCISLLFFLLFSQDNLKGYSSLNRKEVHVALSTSQMNEMQGGDTNHSLFGPLFCSLLLFFFFIRSLLEILLSLRRCTDEEAIKSEERKRWTWRSYERSN
jgi:hypothetical protein